MSNETQTFYQLDPAKVLQAAEDSGFFTTGELTQLNSYENRVFDIGLETDNPLEQRQAHIIGKFYRPNRWSQASILDEHIFLQDLQQEGIKAVAPLSLKSNSTLMNLDGIFYAFFPKVLGRMPQELLPADLTQVGRLLARVHNVGSQKSAPHRPVLDTSYYGGWDTLDFLYDWVAPEMRNRYFDAAESILHSLDDNLIPEEFIRIHGDCHRGNLLHTGKEFFLVDFDDCVTGPVVQDFWMLLSGDSDNFAQEQDQLLQGYEELRDFPHHQWDLIPALRGLRIVSYAGWIAKRWTDPSFPKIFPEFNTYRYWAEEAEALEKVAWNL